MFLVALPQPGLSTKLKNIVFQTVVSRKQQLGSTKKMVELKCLIKEKEGWIALNKGPTISLAKKGGPKNQIPKVLQFLIKDTTAYHGVNM